MGANDQINFRGPYVESIKKTLLKIKLATGKSQREIVTEAIAAYETYLIRTGIMTDD